MRRYLGETCVGHITGAHKTLDRRKRRELASNISRHAYLLIALYRGDWPAPG